MKIETGYRIVQKNAKPNKKTGFYRSYGLYDPPVAIEDMDVISVSSFLDYIYCPDGHRPLVDEMIVERYVDGNELKERIIENSEFIKRLCKLRDGLFGYHDLTILFEDKELQKKYNVTRQKDDDDTDYDYGKFKAVTRIWKVTKKGIMYFDKVYLEYEKYGKDYKIIDFWKMFDDTVKVCKWHKCKKIS